MKMGSLLKKSLIALLPISLGLGALLGVAKKPAQQVSGYSASSLPTTIDLNDTSAANIRSYYSSLNSLSTSERQGNNLLKNLKTILKNGQKYYSYESGENVWKMYEITDRDWDKSPASSISGYNSSTKKITGYSYNTSDPYIHALYVNRDVNNQTTAWSDHQQTQWGINREHVWPKAEGFDSSGAGGARGDPRHLMAGNGYANNIHSNYYYGYVKSSGATDCGTKYSNLSGNLKGTSKTLNSGTVFEPQDSDKGDIARSIFYMVARYNYLSGSDSDGIDTNNPNLALTQDISDWSSSGYTSSTSRQGKLGVLTDLLAWHHADPVDEYEIHRNNLLYTNFTNNRNPFIDFPEWADFIWGTATYNGTTYQSYSSTPAGYATPSSDTINGYNSGGGSDPVSVTGVALNKSSTSIHVGESEVLSATISPNNATNQGLSWTSSNTGVATVSSSGRVSGVAEGNTTIIVTTSDGGFTATCSVTVTASSGGGGGGGASETDTMCAKGFGGYTTSSYSAAGTDYTGVANLTNNSGATYAMQVFNGSTGQVRGNQSGSANFSCRNTTAYSGYYISEVSLTVDDGGTIDGSDSNRSVVWFGSSAYLNPSTAPSTGTKVTASPSSSGQSTLTWTNSNTDYNYFILYNLKASSAPKSKDTDTPLSVTWSPISSSTVALDSITLDTSDVQTVFYIGDTFNYDDLAVTAHYDDNSEDIVTDYSVSEPNLTVLGTQTVEVTYEENSVQKTATYDITVKHPGKTATSQMIVSKPTSTYYSEGAICPLKDSDTVGSAECDAFSVVQTKHGGSNPITYEDNELAVYANHSFMITPNEGFTLTSIVIYAKTNNYANAVGTPSNCSKSTSGSVVTLTPANGSLATGFRNTTSSSLINYVMVYFEEDHLSWISPTINVYSGSTLNVADVNSWEVSDGSTIYSEAQLTVKLGGQTISIPYTWSADDDGKTLKAIYNGVSTVESSEVVITQTINNISAETTELYDYTFTSKQFSSAGSLSLDGHTWTQAGTGNGYWGYDSNKGQQFGSGSNPYSVLTLSCSDFSGTINSVTVSTSGASDVNATVQVKVGNTSYGSAKSITSSKKDYTFSTGGKSGTIVITWSQSSSKALYVKEIVVRANYNGNIANSTNHIEAQRTAVKFAKAFNAAMDTTSYCTANISTAWPICSAAYSTFLTEAEALGDTEEAYAKNLIKYATAQYSDDSGEACIERMLRTYEIIVGRYGSDYAFMSDLVTLGQAPISLISVVQGNNKTILVVVIVSLVSVSAIGGYFFLRTRRKEDF